MRRLLPFDWPFDSVVARNRTVCRLAPGTRDHTDGRRADRDEKATK
jgi:hypothetical protein